MLQRRHHFIHIDRRCIVISDIHGNLALFKRLLDKVNYTKNDLLIINGDLIEKGPAILDTLHYIQELSKNPNVYVLAGNCEWAIYNITYKEEFAPFLHQYLNKQPCSIFKEVLQKYHLDASMLDGYALQKFFQDHMKEELDYMNSLYTTIESEDYLFVHAGIENRVDYKNSSLSSLLEQQRFLEKEHPLDQYVVVGHLPTSNYHLHHIDNSIIIDEAKRIISIDGGNQVKPIGNLNALIIDDHKLSAVEVHPDYPLGIIKEDIEIKEYHHHKISWPDYELELIEEGKDFSLCQKVNHGERLYVKNEYLQFKDGKLYGKDDYIDYQMSFTKGDIVEIIEIVGNYAYILYDHEISWIHLDHIVYKK